MKDNDSVAAAMKKCFVFRNLCGKAAGIVIFQIEQIFTKILATPLA